MNYHNNIFPDNHGRGPDPPSPLDPNDAVDYEQLEQEYRDTTMLPDAQEQLQEYLTRTSDTEPDTEVLNSEYAMAYNSEDEAAADRAFEIEQYTKDHPFWCSAYISKASHIVEAATCFNESEHRPSNNQAKPFSLEKVHALMKKQELQPLPRQVSLVVEKAPVPTTNNAYDAAQRLIDLYHIAYAEGSTYIFDSISHRAVDRGEMKKLILDSCRNDVAISGSGQFVKKVYDLLTMEPRIKHDPKDLLRNIVAFNDAVLDLDTRQVHPHSPDLFVTTHLNASFSLGCNRWCPVFEQYLHETTGGDTVLQQRIWEAIGYTLVPDQKGKCFIFFQGASHTGKTVLGNFIKNCFVGDVISPLSIDELSGNFTISDLVGKKLCMDLDLPADPFGKKAVSRLKKLTGGDYISSDVKFSDRVKFTCLAKFVFGSNHAILLPNKDEAFNNRLVVIPFRFTVPKSRQDFDLDKKLALERDSIVVRALDAYQNLRRNSYQFSGSYLPNEVLDDETVSRVDMVASFLNNFCLVDEAVCTPTAELYNRFTQEYGHVYETKDFSEALNKLCASRNYPVAKTRMKIPEAKNWVNGFQGLRLN